MFVNHRKKTKKTTYMYESTEQKLHTADMSLYS